MPASGPVYQPTTVTYEQQDNWTPVSYLSQTVSTVNRVRCIQWLMLISGVILVLVGLIMVVQGVVGLNATEEAGDVDAGHFVMVIAGAVLGFVGLVLLGMYAWYVRRRRGCPCFPTKEQRLARQLDTQAGNNQILTLNPSTDLLVTAQYGPPSEIAYQPPTATDEEETRKLMGSDNKECSADETERMLETDPRIVLRPQSHADDA